MSCDRQQLNRTRALLWVEVCLIDPCVSAGSGSVQLCARANSSALGFSQGVLHRTDSVLSLQIKIDFPLGYVEQQFKISWCHEVNKKVGF